MSAQQPSKKRPRADAAQQPQAPPGVRQAVAAAQQPKAPPGARPAAAALPLSGLAYVSLAYDADDDDDTEACAGVFLQPVAGDARALTVLFADVELSDGQLAGAFAAACGEVVVSGRRAVPAGGATFRGVTLRCSAPRGVLRALALSSAFPAAAAAGGGGGATGLRGWLGALEDAKADQRALQRAVDGYMSQFDAAEGAKTAAVAQLATRMEADGFTLVTKGRKPRLEDDVPAAVAPAFESDNQKRKRKRGSVVVGDFYAWQAGQRRASGLEELRRRFEEDKERVQRIKAARVFKPR